MTFSRCAIQRVAAFGVVIGAMTWPGAAHAQSSNGSNLEVRSSGYGNLSGALPSRVREDGAGGVAEAELELTPQLKTASGVVFAVRAVANVSGSASGGRSARSLSVPEVSLFATGPFGRLEIGVRAGFPQSLVGFTPSEIAFTSPAFGPESGARLDPDGRLPTRFLPVGLASRIDALTYLGYAARFYDDRSFKVTYLTPRSRSGFYGAVSYTPVTNRPAGFRIAGSSREGASSIPGSSQAGRRRDLVQSALVWNHRTETIDLSIGATYSRSVGDGPRIAVTSSLSGGATITLRDTWTIGVSVTRDDILTSPTNSSGRAPFGLVVSTDYVQGRWVVGGYYQHASADARTALPQRDAVDIGEFGLSYLLDANHDLLGQRYHTEAKLFSSLYFYSLRSEGVLPSRAIGQVFVAGARFSFY